MSGRRRPARTSSLSAREIVTQAPKRARIAPLRPYPDRTGRKGARRLKYARRDSRRESVEGQVPRWRRGIREPRWRGIGRQGCSRLDRDSPTSGPTVVNESAISENWHPERQYLGASVSLVPCLCCLLDPET